MGILNRTYCTVIGPMQYSNGRAIRQYFKEELNKLGIILFDHYNKPFFSDIDETEDLEKHFSQLIEKEKYDEFSSYRSIRMHDLALIDKSDFIIYNYIPGIVTVGSWEEFFRAMDLGKPVFFITEGGKRLTPRWVFWTIPHHYIYSSKEEVADILKKIDSGEKEIDNERWKILKPEFH